MRAHHVFELESDENRRSEGREAEAERDALGRGIALDEMLSVGGDRGESLTLVDTIADSGEGPVEPPADDTIH